MNERWKNYLQEQEKREKYQIFCDMDGVIVDLIGGINKEIYEEAPSDVSVRYKQAQQKARAALNGEELKEDDVNKYHKQFKKPVRNFMYKVMNDNRRFWARLDWHPGGEQLWNYIKNYDPIILSRPTDLQSVIGKKKWVKDHLGLTGDKVQIRFDKTPYAEYKNKIGLLIDDFESNTIPFKESGGEVILFRDVSQAIKELEKYGFTQN